MTHQPDGDSIHDLAGEAADAIEEQLRAFADGIGEERVLDTEETRRLVEEQTAEKLADGLRARGVPEEWWAHRLIDVEAEVTQVGEALGFQVTVPADLQHWMQRPVVRYDPGRPPV